MPLRERVRESADAAAQTNVGDLSPEESDLSARNSGNIKVIEAELRREMQVQLDAELDILRAQQRQAAAVIQGLTARVSAFENRKR